MIIKAIKRCFCLAWVLTQYCKTNSYNINNDNYQIQLYSINDIGQSSRLPKIKAMDEIEFLDNSRFSTLDYVLLVSILSISFIIGIITSLKGNKSPEEFLLGNRNFSPIPVSMSLLTTVISAVNIVGKYGDDDVGITTEVYVYGTQLSPMSFGCMAGIAFSIVVIIPVIYPLKLISIHEYIDLRFHAPRLQTFMMIIIVFNAHVWIGLALYATSLALSAVSPISFTVFILVIGSVCTIYSTIGGIRAVVYTDVFQFVVMSIGLFILIIAGFTEVGGVEKLFEIAEQGKRLEFFNMNPSIYERHNLYNTFAFGAFVYGAMFGISQFNTQRVCAVATLEHSKLYNKPAQNLND
ncbi:Sodium-dependent multivitamin transporter [Armadillidium vulgare]|nr:Sodium-dependent multivitamin transporter [Armadillidium vulgare]